MTAPAPVAVERLSEGDKYGLLLDVVGAVVVTGRVRLLVPILR